MPIAAADGWAVGTISHPSSFASQTLAYHWDGTAWTRSSTPNPAGPAQENGLNAVAARAGNDAWAVGGYAPYPKPQASLVLHWKGTAWAQVEVPNIGSLDAVSVAAGARLGRRRRPGGPVQRHDLDQAAGSAVATQRHHRPGP